MTHKNFSSGTPWEPLVGYSRAVRVGGQVFVSGTTASDEHGQVQCPGDAYGQTRYILNKIQAALAGCQATLADVVRTRIFVTDIDQWEAIGRAHSEFFGEIRPACTMVEVSRLVGADLLVEIEADAVVSKPQPEA